MSDPGRQWLKLWHRTLSDPGFQRLSLDDRGRWVGLLLLIGAHGTAGRLCLKSGFRLLNDCLWPARSLSRSLPKKESRQYLEIVDRLPGVRIEPHDDHPDIILVNWYKYQVDSSSTRTRRYRAARDGQSNGFPSSHVTPQEVEKSKNKNPPYPHHAVTVTSRHASDDCGHSGADITKLDCSDRHFAARRAYLAAHPPQQTPDTTP